MKVLSVITARGGSKGIPGKNIVDLGGKPLIAWTIEASVNSFLVDRTIVSTDDEKIAEISRSFGAEVPFMRPEELSRDNSPHIPVIQHAVRWMEENQREFYDYILLLQPTVPFRSSADIDEAIKIVEEKRPDALLSACEPENHPSLVKKLNQSGFMEYFIPRDEKVYMCRQTLPDAFSDNGAIFLTRCDVLMERGLLHPAGSTMIYLMPKERSLDIDTPWDLYIARLIVEDIKKNGGQPLELAHLNQ
ncbi:MAG: hypothetical protein A2020_01870 [Lentisphaerae bacterium GWF2_45_14]|nr:MAG: hypothetical protein A2020_01870 [Lentisphaerae bacterium GWF2_45_14]